MLIPCTSWVVPPASTGISRSVHHHLSYHDLLSHCSHISCRYNGHGQVEAASERSPRIMDLLKSNTLSCRSCINTWVPPCAPCCSTRALAASTPRQCVSPNLTAKRTLVPKIHTNLATRAVPRHLSGPDDLENDSYDYDLVKGARIQFSDSPSLPLRRRTLLQWTHTPRKVLLVKKPRHQAATDRLIQIGCWLKARGFAVYVERAVWATECKSEGFHAFEAHNTDVDFCITLGGDGTVLYLCSLFERDETLPPVLSFSMGSLGFLTPFDAADYDSILQMVFDTDVSPLHCTLRTRKRCEVVLEGELQAVHHVLNEVVIDRGAFPSTVLLEVFVDRTYVTSVEADGLIIATPSGSTAYSMSAGGPMVAPSVPCTILTPIAPLSLSFRPVVLPESSDVCIHLPKRSRANARASFDGKHSMRIKRDTSLFFSASLSPLPVITLSRMDHDWYDGITSKLKWNSPTRSLPVFPEPTPGSPTPPGPQVYPYSMLPRPKTSTGRLAPRQLPTASYDMHDLQSWQDAHGGSSSSSYDGIDGVSMGGSALSARPGEGCERGPNSAESTAEMDEDEESTTSSPYDCRDSRHAVSQQAAMGVAALGISSGGGTSNGRSAAAGEASGSGHSIPSALNGNGNGVAGTGHDNVSGSASSSMNDTPRDGQLVLNEAMLAALEQVKAR